MVRFEVLGPLRAWQGDNELDLGFPQQRALLGLLLVQAGRPVGMDDIVDVLWGERTPDSAVNMVRRYVGMLRRLLEPELPTRAAGHRLVRRAGGYVLEVTEDEVDLLQFRALARSGRRAAATGRSEEAVDLFSQALSRWRGPVGMGIPESVRTHVVFASVGHELVHTVQLAADAALLCGQAARVLPWLRRAAASDPLDESLQARLVMTLAAAGLQAEALTAYGDTRHRLAEELGVSPGSELSDAHTRVLRQQLPQPGPTHQAERQEIPSEVLETLVRPAQLPAGLAVFAGRRTALARLRDITGEVTSTTPGAPATVLLSGMAGVGKTTLAVHWAHTVADRFPDGQLYVDLRGFDPARAAMDTAEALSGMLEAWGLPPHRIPTGVDALAGLYRSLLVGRRVLVLLENAYDTEQVRPLMPSSPGSLTLVTSRNTLPGLIATGARPLRLEPPSRTDAHAVLALRTGAERLAAEPEAADEIIEQCGRLPLALALVAARVQNNQHFALSAVAAELRSSQDSLDAFSGDGGATDARAAFACSYRLLSPDGARVFRLLSLHPGPDIAVRTAAALAALPIRTARTALGELANAHLVMERVPGRYGLHDLLRVFATELTEIHDAPAERRAAQHRMFDHYLHSAYAADQVLSSNANPLRLAPAQSDALPEAFADHRGALAWFTAERAALMAAVTEAMKTKFLTHAWQLPCCIQTFLDRQGHWQDMAASQRTGVDAAREDGDLLGEITTLRKLARVLADLNQHEAARGHLKRAFEVATELGDPAEQAYTHTAMNRLLETQQRYGEALDQVSEALRLFRDIGRRSSEAMQLNNMGWLHTKLGNYEEAVARSEEAISLTQELGDPYHEAASWDTLASAYFGLGEFKETIRCARRALDVLPEGGDVFNEALIRERLADAYAAVGDQDAARISWHRAADMLERLQRPEAERVRAKLGASVAPPHERP